MSIEEKATIISDNNLTIAENMNKVYEADSIKQWKIIQNEGKRTSYVYAFGSGFTKENFKPLYNFDITNANGMFSNFGRFMIGEGTVMSEKINLREILEDRGIEFSTERCTNFAGFALNSYITELPTINLKSVTSVGSIFDEATVLEKIEKLVVHEHNVFHATNGFRKCEKLKSMLVEGTFNSSVNFSSCPLDKATIESIYTALSETTNGLSVTFKKSAVNTAFGIDVDNETTFPEGSEYYNIRHSRDNWNVVYAE
jgi:hypothetical protein